MTDQPDTPDNTEALEAEDQTQPATPELSPEDWQREAEKARKEAAKYRTKLREREAAEEKAAEEKRKAEQTAEERAKEAEAKAQEALTAAEKRVQTAERKAALAGKVSNPERVLRLMDDPDEYFTEADPDVDRIVQDFPEYAPGEKPTARSVTAPEGTSSRPLTIEDFRGKSQEWIIANRSRLKRD